MIRVILFCAALLHAAAVEPELRSFELPDQFGKTHCISIPGDRPLLITIADRDGAAAMDAWIAALTKRYGTNVSYVAIADVRKTPALMRAFVKAQFKKKYSHPVLLDWEGKISVRLSAKPNVPNLYLFDTRGELIVSKHEIYSEDAASDFPVGQALSATTTDR